MRKNGRTAHKLKKLAWRFKQPEWADNHGVMLPVKHRLVSSGIAREIYLGDYEAKEIEIISKRLDAGDVVFEVGAGLGYLSAYCAKHTGSDKVHTYEANPELISLIRETHARNDVTPTVTNALLAQGDGEREFRIEDDFWASSAHREGGRAITVKQLDLNTELARIRPSFMIVDIEGGEAELFAGARLDCVRKICVETHSDVLGDRVLSEMFAGLVGKGFALDFSLIRKNVFFFHRVA
jgi:FkbM family methyltransferase